MVNQPLDGNESPIDAHQTLNAGTPLDTSVARSKAVDAMLPVGLKMFPEKFKTHPRFPELIGLVRDITNHEAMKVGNENTRHNMMRASLAFTVCFYGNLHASLRGIVDKALEDAEEPLHTPLMRLQTQLQEHSFAVHKENDTLHKALSDTIAALGEDRSNHKLLHLFLDLANGELATQNIETETTKAGHYSPHYVAMLEACEEAGVNAQKMEALIGGMAKPDASIEQTLTDIQPSPELAAYYAYSEQCTHQPEKCFATIALRELSLADNFKVIKAHLPKDDKYRLYEDFLGKHIDLDQGEEGTEMEEDKHGALMAEALAEVENVDDALNTMISFYALRKRVYDACLKEEGLY